MTDMLGQALVLVFFVGAGCIMADEVRRMYGWRVRLWIDRRRAVYVPRGWAELERMGMLNQGDRPPAGIRPAVRRVRGKHHG